MANFITTAFRAAIGQTINITTATDAEIKEFFAGGNTSIGGRSITDSNALKVAAAYRCVNIISGVVSWIPIDLIRRIDENTRKPAVGHPLRKVLTVRPNAWQTPKEFRQLMQTYVMLRGNAVALKVKALGNVSALIPIHPDRVLIEQESNLQMKYTVTLLDGSTKVYRSADVLHLRGLSLNGYAGLSVLSHMRESLGIALDGEIAAATLFKNGSFVDTVIKHPEKMSKEAYERLKESWEKRKTGVDNAGKTAILEEGASLDKVSMSARDLQFIESRDFQRYDIAMFFGVPPHMIGATEKTTSWGSGIEQQNIGFVTYTLNDWLVMWQEALKRDTINENEWETLDVRFFTQALLKGDTKAQWDAFTRGRQWGVYNANDIRAMLDLNPRTLQDGSIDPEGYEYASPPNQNPDANQDDTEKDPANEPA
ncbi:phage portal protein [Rhizobium leguminosarum]|uniref:phage portal protein n=1 Tax=Rhizobium leguminosarum TaxID=384 RepID=UPI0014421316|nr:phage portal protein [Rhizobium leguminosarum]MBY5863255.1 phage portal protein [Rhizobium leguminosarum]NKM04134.1 phage portal protein [Rhizobium leguminosarum bv. viciae]